MRLNRMIILLTLLVSITILSFAIVTSQDTINAEEIMKDIDRKLTINSDLYARLSLVTKKPDPDGRDEPLVESRMGEFYRKDDENKFLFIFTAPKVDAGTGYLFIDDNLWFYDKNSREFSKRTASDSIGGSDSRSRDLRKSTLAEDFDWEYVGEETIKGVECYEFYGEAAVQDVAYPISRVWVRKDVLLPFVRREYSLASASSEDRDNKLVQTIYYLRYKRKSAEGNDQIDKYTASKILVQNHQDNSRTVLEFEDVSFDDQPDNIFTKAYLENRSN
jgi:outer membrane lipoprotein-sorting protein